MFRFDQLIRRDMVVRDVKHRHPETIAVFEQFGFRPVCDDCEVVTGARRSGVDIGELLDALNLAAFGDRPGSDETGEHANG
jgi:hypothetical protein